MQLSGKTALWCALFAFCASCAGAEAARHEVHLTGTVQAVHFFTVLTPQIGGQGGRVTLTRIIASGTRVKTGDLLAEFDRTQEMDNARDAKAKFDDLSHQVEQRQAQNRADAAKRASDLQSADADLAKAELELKKGPLLSEIDRLKNEVKADAAREHVASLKKSSAFHDQADAAAVRILELQRDRQKVGLDRALSNADKLQIHAPLDGMVALENVWRNSSMGKAQEGDQLWPGQPLIRLFDPSEMEVRAQVGEPDDAALTPGCRARVRLDAYPDLTFEAHMVSASPVASSALGSPIKTFSARFRLEKSDPHLLPDLSAAVVLAP
jgi:membrane fusion protein (multidrug efflux system)